MKRIILFAIAIMFCLGNLSLASLEGSGRGKNIDFDLVKLSVEKERVDLEFNKNITNIMVKENNEKCFKIIKSDETQMISEVVLADDQLEREKRRQVILKIKDGLHKEETYKLIIDGNLRAKNGEVLGGNMELEIKLGDKFDNTPAHDIEKDFENEEIKNELDLNYVFILIIIILVIISFTYSYKKYKKT